MTDGPFEVAIEVVIEDGRWREAGIEALADRALGALAQAGGLVCGPCEIAVLACDDARISELNRAFRDKPAPTNVLSWPASDVAPGPDGLPPPLPAAHENEPLALGDMAISFDTCAREAQAQNKDFADHVTHLLVHAGLHLLGYDHVREIEAAAMEGREVAILAKLGIANPY